VTTNKQPKSVTATNRAKETTAETKKQKNNNKIYNTKNCELNCQAGYRQ